jgi:peptidoglycan/xylan/chitin deacetylase (PgdA/CDA1 family)
MYSNKRKSNVGVIIGIIICVVILVGELFFLRAAVQQRQQSEQAQVSQGLSLVSQATQQGSAGGAAGAASDTPAATTATTAQDAASPSKQLSHPRQDKSRAIYVAKGQAYKHTKDYGLPILMYHYFFDPAKGEKGKNSDWMDINSFAAQVKWLCQEHYYFPTWPEVEAYFNGTCELPRHSIVLTSDDGHKDFYSEAAPVIQRYAAQGARMTGFVILDKFDKSNLQKYDANVISFQAHSYGMHKAGLHGERGALLTSTAAQIQADAKTCQGILGKFVAYCYPYGSVTPKIEQNLKTAGVGLGLAIINKRAHHSDDPMDVPRVRMSMGISLATFKAVVS